MVRQLNVPVAMVITGLYMEDLWLQGGLTGKVRCRIDGAKMLYTYSLFCSYILTAAAFICIVLDNKFTKMLIKTDKHDTGIFFCHCLQINKNLQ